MKSVNLIPATFETYSRNGSTITVTFRFDKSRVRVLIHPVDFKYLLDSMRKAEASSVLAAQSILDTAEGKK